MSGGLWRWIERCGSLLDDPAERQAVLGDIEEGGTAGGRELLDLMGLVFLRRLASWKSWRPWIATAPLFLPVCGVVSPALSIAWYVSRRAEPSSSPTDLHALSILLGIAVITLLMASAVGFTLGRLVRSCVVTAVPVLAFMFGLFSGVTFATRSRVVFPA